MLTIQPPPQDVFSDHQHTVLHIPVPHPRTVACSRALCVRRTVCVIPCSYLRGGTFADESADRADRMHARAPREARRSPAGTGRRSSRCIFFSRTCRRAGLSWVSFRRTHLARERRRPEPVAEHWHLSGANKGRRSLKTVAPKNPSVPSG